MNENVKDIHYLVHYIKERLTKIKEQKNLKINWYANRQYP